MALFLCLVKSLFIQFFLTFSGCSAPSMLRAPLLVWRKISSLKMNFCGQSGWLISGHFIAFGEGAQKNSCNHRCNYFLSNRFPIIRAGRPSFQESWYSPKYGGSPYHQDGCGCRHHHRPYRRRGRAPAPWCSRASWHTP